MKKGLLFLTLSTIAISMFAFGGKNNSKNATFIDCGYDAIDNHYKVEKLNAITVSEPEGANKDAGNTASIESSKIATQFGVNSNGQNCVRFVVAIPSLGVEVVFNRTLTKTNGSKSYGQVVATAAYDSIKASGTNVVTPDSWNNQFAGADYKYFAIYTLTGIPESELNATIEISATITTSAAEESNEENSGTRLEAPKEPKSVEVYNSASFMELKQKDMPIDGSGLTYVDGKLKPGQEIKDPVTGNIYKVADDGTLIASNAKSSSSGLVVVSSIYVKEGDEIVEYQVSTLASNFCKGSDKNATVMIPGSVKTFQANAFKGLNSISGIVFGGTLDEWKAISNKKVAFMNCVKGTISLVCNDGIEHRYNVETDKID